MLEDGWTFTDDPSVVPDTVNHSHFMHQIYSAADPHYTGRVTVPVLWDKRMRTIVSNESSEIIRMLNSAFDATGAKDAAKAACRNGQALAPVRRGEIKRPNGHDSGRIY